MTGCPVDDTAVLNALFADSPQGLFVFDAERKVTRYNPAARGVRGLAAEDVVGHPVEDFVPGFGSHELGSLIDEVFVTGEPLRSRLVRGPAPSDPRLTLSIEVSLFPLPSHDGRIPGLVGVIEDVTERQAAAERLAVLSAVHANVGSTLEVETTADELVRALVPAFADAAGVDLLEEGPGGGAPRAGPVSTDVPLRRVAFAPPTIEPARKKGDSLPFPFPTPYTQALNDTHARLVRVTPDDPWLSADRDGFTPLIAAEVRSMIVAPLMARETVLGLLTLYRNRAEDFEEADLDVAQQAAATASAHLDNARSYRREHTVASALQRRLQPGDIPRLSAVDTAHVYLPEGAGGAWFDVIPLSGTRVALVVGDVTGHGIEAAATMGQLRIALRTLALQDLEPDEVLIHLDDVVTQLPAADGPGEDGHTATCAIAVHDPVSRQCTLIRAGHPAPVVVDPDGAPLALDVPQGPPLGAGGEQPFASTTVQLAPGSLLALCTRALLASGKEGETAARHDLEHVLATTSRPLQELCDTAVYRMAPSRQDDAVLLLARVHALTPEQVADWTLPSDPSVVGTARRLVDRQLASWHLDGASYTTGLIVSELVTNAIRYGKGPVRLRLIHDQKRLLSEVTDANTVSPRLRHARTSDEGGRGLYIVMRLSSQWGVRHSRRDKTIWSEQDLGGAPGDPLTLMDAFDLAGAAEL
ncbi:MULTISPECIES: SpoIIE family protein phosphatase [unclassified Streptomyces]|uniref:ATP-binding SpoIIE family protein phosphatase n=1 Tax=unclassified Streptomyces TaxID=2593676 RepID=UPI000F6BCECD|nr:MULTISPECIES: SpoIIE family protein phosphatase [unclassified Streptomyces]AZM61121.1 phosphatase [Streptomyces sp. WAC 01438]RSM95358.1 phosphatase [Streptomyces sp. WAC 01420]